MVRRIATVILAILVIGLVIGLAADQFNWELPGFTQGVYGEFGIDVAGKGANGLGNMEDPERGGDEVSGELAWHQDTDEGTHEASPVGALGSQLPIILEIWGPTENGNKGYVVTIPAGSIAWMQNHYGGTGWWVSQSDLEAAVRNSVLSITNRDGVEPTVVRLPNGNIPFLGCLQSKPVDGGTRTCDQVGGQQSFNLGTGDPAPGFMPGGEDNSSEGVKASGVTGQATVKAGCNIRNEPAGQSIEQFGTATQVTLGSASTKEAELNGRNYTWQQIVLPDGRTGWVATEACLLNSQSASVPSQGQSAGTNAAKLDYASLNLSGSLSCSGPAILETDNGGALVVRVDQGTTLNYPVGKCWDLPDQSALNARYPDHVDEFRVNYPNASAFPDPAEG